MKYFLITLSLVATGMFLLSFGTGLSGWLFALIGVSVQLAAVIYLPELLTSHSFNSVGAGIALAMVMTFSVAGSFSLLNDMLVQLPSGESPTALTQQRQVLLGDIHQRQETIKVFLEYNRATKAESAQAALERRQNDLKDLDREIQDWKEKNQPTGVYAAVITLFGEHAKTAITSLVLGFSFLLDFVTLIIPAGGSVVIPARQQSTPTSESSGARGISGLDKLAAKDAELTRKESQLNSKPTNDPLLKKAQSLVNSGQLNRTDGYRKIQPALGCTQADAKRVARNLKTA